jgi:hypothetical protein
MMALTIHSACPGKVGTGFGGHAQRQKLERIRCEPIGMRSKRELAMRAQAVAHEIPSTRRFGAARQVPDVRPRAAEQHDAVELGSSPGLQLPELVRPSEWLPLIWVAKRAGSPASKRQCDPRRHRVPLLESTRSAMGSPHLLGRS